MLEYQIQDFCTLSSGWIVIGAAAEAGAALWSNERVAQISLNQIANIADKLQRDRIIQPKLFCFLLHHRFRRHTSNNQARGVSRHNSEQRENCECDYENDPQTLEEPTEEETQDKHFRMPFR